MKAEFKWALLAAGFSFLVCVVVAVGISSVHDPTEGQIRLQWVFEHGITLSFGFFFGGLIGKSAVLDH